uniref:Olfactory receptor family 52 subfamily B member 6 n=1 Tax=Balaenoptera musculus TaxID=9771 RepID=A0A8C0E2L5_BALMU
MVNIDQTVYLQTHVVMPASNTNDDTAVNNSDTCLAGCFLIGIPGLEHLHIWLSILFRTMYVDALAGSGILICVILSQPSLQEPRYIFLSMLVSADLLLSTSTMPKALANFWLGSHISFDGCLAQLFFIHFLFVADSAVLLAMVFDGYMAISSPLRYATIFTSTVIGKIVAATLAHSFFIMFPPIFLLKRLHNCQINIITHTFCEHVGILACASIKVTVIYGLIAFSMGYIDLSVIGFSYVQILRAVFYLPSSDAHLKALRTCGSHVCLMLAFYLPALFSFMSHCFGHNIPHYIHILLANLYVVFPPALNPVIYGVRTKQIRERALRMLNPKSY